MSEQADEKHSERGLRVQDLTVRFGGHVAVDALTFSANEGQITGLIGPNGAGKTTTFNACCGMLALQDGKVTLLGEDVTSVAAHVRAQRGLGRTFQRMELFDSLSVADNIGLGREATLAGSRPLRHLFASRSDKDEIAQAVQDAVDLCGLEKLLYSNVGILSTGQRRMVELARAIASRPRVLLLDEPSSGLDPKETAAFGDVLLELVDRRGLGVLLVEHDIALVMRVCGYIYVLDFGELVFEGTADAVATSEIVRAAYLGSEAVEELA